MAVENIGKTLQYLSAALGIPAAAAGMYSVYQTYAGDVMCQNLRASIVSIMEQNLSPEVKRALLRKNVDEFGTKCGDKDPAARLMFQSAVKADTPASAIVSGPQSATSATPSGAPDGVPSYVAELFGRTSSGELRGWVALTRVSNGAVQPNFDGFALSLSSLPPVGTVLRARDTLPVWRQPQRGPNDQSQAQGRVPAGRCVHVLGTRSAEGGERTWGDVAPIACPATLPAAAN